MLYVLQEHNTGEYRIMSETNQQRQLRQTVAKLFDNFIQKYMKEENGKKKRKKSWSVITHHLFLHIIPKSLPGLFQVWLG